MIFLDLILIFLRKRETIGLFLLRGMRPPTGIPPISAMDQIQSWCWTTLIVLNLKIKFQCKKSAKTQSFCKEFRLERRHSRGPYILLIFITKALDPICRVWTPLQETIAKVTANFLYSCLAISSPILASWVKNPCHCIFDLEVFVCYLMMKFRFFFYSKNLVILTFPFC